DLQGVADKIHTFYLKTSDFDRPLKVDFLGRGNAKAIASMLLSVSGHHPGYGFPAPLIEADNVACLQENEMSHFHSQIVRLVGNIPSVMTLRREQRPF
ncbi:MAG: DNA double-strand break repair nuclease NurA, partial [Candidatus Aenigmarchaeota archaeon]|nr:DNA double-strand break repair nuclease NurA [Candidatus Aenigmarchaeota archaeon]